MNERLGGYDFHFIGEHLVVLPSGALYWPARSLLCVSDLHLGKSERLARRGGLLLPPYEARETLQKLEADIAATAPEIVVCLGDSFDDLDAARALDDDTKSWLDALIAGRRWIWIEGNHDAGPVEIAGTHLDTLYEPPLVFRHVASGRVRGEISGHYHPKARVVSRGRSITRRCALADAEKAILPAYGTYTGGLRSDAADLSAMMGPGARAILLAEPPLVIPMPRAEP
ncbi:MAG: ligase-associated DNA damage response endonuclease PdeM [Pseudomonadota bacterium]